MTTELLKPGYSNMSCTEDECASTGAVMSTELEVSIEKKDSVVVENTEIIFKPFCKRKRKLYLNTNGALHTF